MAFAGGMLAGCRPGPPPASPMPSGVSAQPLDMPIVISIAGQFDDEILAVLEEQVASFETANPGTWVELVRASRTAPERHEKFSTGLAAEDTSVDIYVLDYPWLAEFAAAGWLMPLGDYVHSSSVALDAFLPSTVEASTIGGHLLALPWATDGGVLYYRQDLLDKHGYAPPTTWADVSRVALDVKTKEGLPHGFVWQGAPYESLTCNTLEFVWAYGGDVLDDAGEVIFDSPQARAALQQMSDLVTISASPSEITTYREDRALSDFRDGNAVLMRNWSYAWDRVNGQNSAVAGRVGMAPLPASCLGGQGLALSAYSRHKPEAFRFMAFLAGYKQQVQAALLADQPPTLSAAFSDADLLAADPGWQDLYAALAVTRPRPRAVPYDKLSSIIYTEVAEMLTGQQDPAKTAANIQQDVEAALQEQ